MALVIYLGNKMKNIAVIGAGTMGAGIAQLAAKYGCSVRLIEINESVLNESLAAINKRLDRSVEKGKITRQDADNLINRIQPASVIENLQDVELVIEAVVEDIAIKHKVFKSLEAATSDSTILASNTSSISIGLIAEAVTNPSRVVGMHFFNPAPVMPLVEIIASDKSNKEHVDLAYETVKEWGKIPVRAKDTPGFIVNRVARGFYLEALRLLGEGVAGVDEIDQVMKNNGKFRMGPFELMDLVGLDVNLAVSTSVWQQMEQHPRFIPHAIQRKLVEQGHLGRKSKQGFYLYADDNHPLSAFQVDRRSFELSPLFADVMRVFATKACEAEMTGTEQYIFSRILGAIINEAGLAYSDGVASSDDIDIAMMKGTNYPKGPLVWADEIGHRNVRGLLKSLNDHVDDNRYMPAPLYQNAT